MGPGVRSRGFVILLLLILSPISIFLALTVGPANIPLSLVIKTLLGNGTDLSNTIILDIRLPRVLAAFMAGAILAIAGSMSQSVFRNPLGDPYLLGISSGASLGAVLGFLIDPSLIPFTAFLMALLVSFLVYSLGMSAGGTPTSLVLAGIAIGMFINAIVWYLILSLPDIHGFYSWFLGSLSTVMWRQTWILIMVFPVTLVGIALYQWFNLLMLRDEEAESLGLNVKVGRSVAILLISILTATVVSIGGLIGFVGLVVPHICRLIVGANHKYLMPSALLFGGIFLLAADTLARAGSVEIPVGIITAIMGAPLFAYLLVRSHVKG